MSGFEALIKFVAKEDQEVYFAPTLSSKNGESGTPLAETSVTGFPSIDDLKANTRGKKLTVGKYDGVESYSQVLAPIPSSTLPIYCVGLNYRSHAKEAKLDVPKYPPLWTKPASSLADPEQKITMNEFCALSLPDYEGELVFVTSREAKDIQASEADSYILGYTIGNDLSCRYFQIHSNSGGQFFFAKAFDNFAPIGPILVSTEHYRAARFPRRLVTKVNGEVVQDVVIEEDMIFSPAQILSHMSRGTTIPAGTAVMTGTPAGVGAFRSPKSFLKEGDVVEIGIDQLGTLRNAIHFENLIWWQRLYLTLQNVVLRIAT